jgi:hypothetical protein
MIGESNIRANMRPVVKGLTTGRIILLGDD